MSVLFAILLFSMLIFVHELGHFLTAKLSGLTKDGSYYISAMLVDARGRHSPVKVTAFTTPDDTVPAFATGYPYTNMTFSKTDAAGKEQIVQAMVMPTALRAMAIGE